MTVRLWIPLPSPDESIASILWRAACFLEIDPNVLWGHIVSDVPGDPGTMDAPSSNALRRIANGIGMTPSRLAAHRIPVGETLLEPNARTAACPLCWQEDDVNGRPRTYRRAWAYACRTFCRQHRVPLVAPRRPGHLDLSANTHDYARLSGAEHETIVQMIDFEDRIAAVLDGAEQWPIEWAGSASGFKVALAQLVSENAATGGRPLVCNIYVSRALEPYIHGPKHYGSLRNSERWLAFLRERNPAVRRAALWLATVYVSPERATDHASGLPARLLQKIFSADQILD
ncbi:MAG: TniQ family protein [Arenimonas sp.]|uniref:TniQ family protein n=1 Tax=Arenimonas sp. MALMAid1274 TaxID=3411630 RepID=UPI0031C8CF1B|nr:TniQ family protein [Arenimonas sp.]